MHSYENSQVSKCALTAHLAESLRNDLLCVEWDVISSASSLTHSFTAAEPLTVVYSNKLQIKNAQVDMGVDCRVGVEVRGVRVGLESESDSESPF